MTLRDKRIPYERLELIMFAGAIATPVCIFAYCWWVSLR